MKNTTKTKLGVSLTVLAFSLFAGIPAHAEDGGTSSSPLISSGANSSAVNSALTNGAYQATVDKTQMTHQVTMSSAVAADKYLLDSDKYKFVTSTPIKLDDLQEYTALKANNLVLKDAVLATKIDSEFVKKFDKLDISDAVASIESAGTTCADTPPSCNSLGYTSSASSCQGQMLRCPFDTSIVFCIENCKKGSFLYSDMTCSDTKISGKTVIGIVINPSKRRAMALKCPKYKWATKELKTAVYTGNDLQVKEFVSFDTVNTKYTLDTAIKTEDDLVASLNNAIYTDAGTSLRTGEVATKRIVDLTTDQIEYPAANFTLSLSTEGVAAGKWFLPNSEEALEMVSSKDLLTESFKKLDLAYPLASEKLVWTSDLLNAKPIAIDLELKKFEPADAAVERPVCPFIYY